MPCLAFNSELLLILKLLKSIISNLLTSVELRSVVFTFKFIKFKLLVLVLLKSLIFNLLDNVLLISVVLVVYVLIFNLVANNWETSVLSAFLSKIS